MALFSDIDWMILLGAGAFLLLGKENAAVLRTLGRYYGRFVRLKNELLGEVAKAADLPLVAAPGGPRLTLRQSILGWEGELGRTPTAVPAAVAAPALPPTAIARPFGDATTTIPGLGPTSWSLSLTTAATVPSEEP